MIGVVFSHYRLPEKRLQDHFVWNRESYSRDVRVFIAADREYAVPEYAKCLVLPPMEIFSLSKTSNAAIQAALEAGCDPIIKIDPDIVFPEDTWIVMANVERAACQCPVYEYVHSFERRSEPYNITPCAMGVLSMQAENWRKVRYDERMVGWGCEDVCLLMDIEDTGVRVWRMLHVWHIAHEVEDANQRMTFNPCRNQENYAFVDERLRRRRGEPK